MVSLTGFRNRFTSRWRLMILGLLVIGLFLRLGAWQLSRAQEKKTMISNQQSFSAKKPVAWHAKEPYPANYQRIDVQGQYVQKNLLLDNQHHKHRFGYHVLTPLALTNGHIILVDRGWIPADFSQKSELIKTPEGAIKIRGYAYYPSKKRIMLGQMIDNKSPSTTIIEWIDTQDISHFLHKSVYPFIIRLDENEAHGFIREWAIVSMPAERHYAYAFQWFALAFVMLIILIALNRKKKDESNPA